MPTFCRHNRLIQNCPICAREQSIEARPVLSSSAPRISQPRPSSGQSGGSRPGGTRTPREPGRSSGGGLRVRKLARGVDDGYSSRLVPGVRSSVDADRLARELAFATYRLHRLESDPPGLYAEVAAVTEGLEEGTWLAFQIAYLCPLDGADPFAGIEQARTSWASGEEPRVDGAPTGPRAAEDPGGSRGTAEAYRAWAARAGSQAAAFEGEVSWTPERRFERVFERLALPGFHRDARFDLLVTLGRLGLYELEAGSLQFGGDNEVTVAAKRVFGIGDQLLLERRAADLAAAAEIPLEALDLALYNWGRGRRSGLGVPVDEPVEDPDLEPILGALGL